MSDPPCFTQVGQTADFGKYCMKPGRSHRWAVRESTIYERVHHVCLFVFNLGVRNIQPDFGWLGKIATQIRWLLCPSLAHVHHLQRKQLTWLGAFNGATFPIGLSSPQVKEVIYCWLRHRRGLACTSGRQVDWTAAICVYFPF